MNATTHVSADAKTLASQVVGDGGSPNMFFVTTYPDIYVIDKDGDGEYKTVDWLVEERKADYTHTYGPFHSYSEAQRAYDVLELDVHTGVCTVVMEDRHSGTIKEKFLRKVVKVDYHIDEHNMAKYFEYE